MAFVILVQRFLCLLLFLLEALFQWRFHLVQTESHIPLIMLQVLLQCVVLVYNEVA